jgi:hypothetical protein
MSARWVLGFVQQYPWKQCGYCGRAQTHDCPPATCLLCGTVLCFSRGSKCSVCHYGRIPGWSWLDADRCGRKGCDEPAVSKAPRVRQVCTEHAKTTKLRMMGRTVTLTDYVTARIALRDAGTLSVGYDRWRWQR